MDQPVIVQHSINTDISRTVSVHCSFNTQIVINGRFISFVSKQRRIGQRKMRAAVLHCPSLTDLLSLSTLKS